MEYRTMNRKELAKELDVSPSTLWRRMKKLNVDFRNQIEGHSLLFDNEVKYIHEQITGMKKWESGSK